MNEPIEFAQKSTGKITAKQLLDVIKRGPSHLFMHGSASYKRESYSDSYVFELTAKQNRTHWRAEVATKIEVPGWVSNGNTSARETSGVGRDAYQHYDEAYRPLKGCWHFGCGDELLVSALSLLPKAAEVGFHIYLDMGTNGYLTGADYQGSSGNERGLHCDACYLYAWYPNPHKTTEKIVRKFLINVSAGAHNSARFGNPRHERDTVGHPGW